jgi:hypothetical protein
MAIVANKDGQGIKANGVVGVVDPSYDMPTATGGTYPAGASAYTSQIYLNSATGEVYRSLAGGTTQWAETNIR